MRSCLGLLVLLLVLTLVVGGGLIWHLSETAEFSRGGTPSGSSHAPPRAVPATSDAGAPARPPTAIPVAEPVRR